MNPMPTNPTGSAPLAPLAFYILLVLSDRSYRGCGIMEEVERNSQGQLWLSAGTMYNAINSLLKAGLIKATSKKEGEYLRRYYQITGLGQQTLEAERQRLAETARPARPQPALEGGRPG